MRTILLTRGIPASSKSTWVKENKLEPYTLSADNIRLLIQSPVTNIDGKLVITQKNDSKVWALLFNLLEQRMERGEFIVVDGTHYRAELPLRSHPPAFPGTAAESHNVMPDTLHWGSHPLCSQDVHKLSANGRARDSAYCIPHRLLPYTLQNRHGPAR